jgi:hypothetical protein
MEQGGRLGARLPGGLARGGAGQRAGEYRVHHLVEGLLPCVDGDRPECSQAVLMSRQPAAQVLASVPDAERIGDAAVSAGRTAFASPRTAAASV